jgi:hypothetical protein
LKNKKKGNFLMASIKISDLGASEVSLFVDSESFLDELSNSDLATIKGGSLFYVTIAVVSWLLS